MKKILKRIESKLDALLTLGGHSDDVESVNKTIGGGGIKPPKVDKP